MIKKVAKEIEEKEFEQLVKELKTLGFTNSSEVSDYIVKNKLGYKYENISGILEMTNKGNKWNFEGGFPKHIYARLCQELNLENNGTTAKPGQFQSFKALEEQNMEYWDD